MKTNIKKILGIVGVSAIGVIALLWTAISSNKENEECVDDFDDLLRNGTDEELAREREKVRVDYCNPDLDMEYRTSCENKLRRFDDEMSKRAWGDEEPKAPSYHREHGWYLTNDD